MEPVDLADDARLGELLRFAATVGTPRELDPSAYRDRLVGVPHACAYLVRGQEGAITAAGLGTVMPMIATDQVQVNAFCVPGEQQAFGAVLGAMDDWARPLGAQVATAHVSDPRPHEFDAWQASGYREIGRRRRVRRSVTLRDAALAPQLPDGVRILPLVMRPDLEPAADAVWIGGIADIPSALQFAHGPDWTIRRELDIDRDAPFPPSLLVAVDGADEVAAVAMLVTSPSRPLRAVHRLTSVVPGWRGHGLARAIKVELIRWAARNGITTLEASNDEANVAMRRVNDQLGYTADHEIVLFRRAVGRSPRPVDACFAPDPGIIGR